MRFCRPDSSAACVLRYAAVRAGTMWYSLALRGWLRTSPLGVPVPVAWCPFCGGGLPDLAAIVRRYERDGWPDDATGAGAE